MAFASHLDLLLGWEEEKRDIPYTGQQSNHAFICL